MPRPSIKLRKFFDTPKFDGGMSLGETARLKVLRCLEVPLLISACESRFDEAIVVALNLVLLEVSLKPFERNY